MFLSTLFFNNIPGQDFRQVPAWVSIYMFNSFSVCFFNINKHIYVPIFLNTSEKPYFLICKFTSGICLAGYFEAGILDEFGYSCSTHRKGKIMINIVSEKASRKEEAAPHQSDFS
jgi:hypothetical protein